jgi:hypothetical protein
MLTREEIETLRQRAQDECLATQAAAQHRYEERIKALSIVESMIDPEMHPKRPPKPPCPEVNTASIPQRPAIDNLTLIDAVQSIFDHLPDREWTVVSIQRTMADGGFEFGAQNPQGSLNTCLGRLLNDRKTIEIVKRGAGRRPTVYRRIGLPVQSNLAATNGQL